ncbi:MAG TPA: biosynthetic peptidoglycan transglycosylase [Acidiferrobacter sp.]|nr:biosynthetic peptidoglycan transglycosylase [Acidiferrobacter sp.]
MRTIRTLFLIAVTIIVIDLSVIVSRWVSMPHLTKGPVPESRFIRSYRKNRARHKWPRLRWQPVALGTIPHALRLAVILGEDGTFYQNNGFDASAILWAARYDWRAQRIVFGGSTITQQTAKNLFLSPSRSFFRKANEVLLTVALTHLLTKNRILEIYLDDAQFGQGIYGVEAASQYYFGKPVSAINTEEAVELAASLPDPVGSNPAKRSWYFRARTAKILRLLQSTQRPQAPVPGNSSGSHLSPDKTPSGQQAPGQDQKTPPSGATQNPTNGARANKA